MHALFSYISTLSPTPPSKPPPATLAQRLTHTATTTALSQLLSSHERAVLSTASALPNAAIRTANLLITSLTPVFHTLDTYAAVHQNHLHAFQAPRLYLRLAVSPLEHPAHHALAQIARLRGALYAVVGVFVQTLHALQRGLSANANLSTATLLSLVITLCKHIRQFATAVTTAASPTELCHHLHHFLTTALVPLQYPDNVAGKLNQFWHQTPSTNPSETPTIALQMLQAVLVTFPNTPIQLHRILQTTLKPPSNPQLRPLTYTGLAAATLYTGATLRKTARFLGGSGVLEDTVARYADSLATFAVHNVAKPLSDLHAQIFRSAPVAASEHSVAVAHSALRAMLVDFSHKHLAHVPGALAAAEEGSLKVVMDLIREQAARPIRNVLAGNLTQAFLIQVQKLKCDVEELMLKSKQTLRAQELNLALLALLPSLLTAAAVTYLASALLYQWRSRGKEMIVSGGQTALFLLSDVHTAFVVIEDREDAPNEAHTVGVHEAVQCLGKVTMKLNMLNELVESGMVGLADKVERVLKEDLQSLAAAEGSFRRKRRIAQRMLGTYAFLNQL